MESTVQKKGFTLVEVLIALVLSILISAAILTVYHWSAGLGALCGKKNQSQIAAMNSSTRIMDCIRNASEISAIDSENGRWVELTYPGGYKAVLAYTNAPGTANSGALGMFRAGKSPYWFVKHGVTELMGAFDPVVFSVNPDETSTSTSTNILYVRYRVSQPSANGTRDINDGKYAMHVRFAACLRNVGEE